MSLEKREYVDPIILNIDISEAWDTASEVDIFIENLKRAGIYEDNLLFCGFDGRKPARTDGLISCAPEAALKHEVEEENQNPLEYALSKKKPAIAIYDGSKVIEQASYYECRFSDPSALIAIAYLT